MTEPSAVEPSDQTATLPPAGPPPAYAAAPVEPPQEPRARRTLGLPVVAAIAGATLLIGGLIGGIIGYAVHSDSPDFAGRPGLHQHGGPGQRGPQSGPGNGNLPQPPDGQQPDQQDQQQDDGS